MPITSKISLPGNHQGGSEWFEGSVDRADRPLFGIRKAPCGGGLQWREHRPVTSSGGRDQIADAHQVIGGSGEREHPSDSVHAPMPQLIQQADRLAPPK